MNTHRLITGPALTAIATLALAACTREEPPVTQATTPAETPAPLAPPPPPPPPPAPNPDEVASETLASLGAMDSDRGNTLRLASARFAPGETGFEPADASRIDRVAEVLKKHPQMHAVIEGFTDSRGSDRANEAISTKRAESVRQALVARGIDETRLRARGAGESNPVGDNGTPEGREQNRRVEIVFSNTEGRFASASDAAPRG
jgi:outer membrane protein OmpA-like peptidoglycan-associated protein